jgi:hypothetical protein
MPMRIIGKACPLNIANSYKETFSTGALDEFLRSPEAANITMREMHERDVATLLVLVSTIGWVVWPDGDENAQYADPR